MVPDAQKGGTQIVRQMRQTVMRASIRYCKYVWQQNIADRPTSACNLRKCRHDQATRLERSLPCIDEFSTLSCFGLVCMGEERLILSTRQDIPMFVNIALVRHNNNERGLPLHMNSFDPTMSRQKQNAYTPSKLL
jgi:hypothetical protein